MKKYIFLTIISVFLLSLLSCGRSKASESYGQDQLEKNAQFIASLHEGQIIEGSIDREVSPEVISDTLITNCSEVNTSVRYTSTNDDLPKNSRRSDCVVYALPNTQLATFALVRVQEEDNGPIYWVSIPYIMPISQQHQTGMLRLKAKFFYPYGTPKYIALVPATDD